MREKLLAAARDGDWPRSVGAEARKPDYDWIRVMDRSTPPYRSVAEVAAERGVRPGRGHDRPGRRERLRAVLPAADPQRRPGRGAGDHEAPALHPDVLRLGGARQPADGQLDPDPPAELLDAGPPGLHPGGGGRKITLVPATAWGFHDRGLLREGLAADLCVFDPDTIGPAMPDVRHDLPGGSVRLVQKANGIAATVVERRGRAGGRRAHRRLPRPGAARPAGPALTPAHARRLPGEAAEPPAATLAHLLGSTFAGESFVAVHMAWRRDDEWTTQASSPAWRTARAGHPVLSEHLPPHDAPGGSPHRLYAAEATRRLTGDRGRSG